MSDPLLGFVLGMILGLVIALFPVADAWDWFCNTRLMVWYAGLFTRLANFLRRVGGRP